KKNISKVIFISSLFLIFSFNTYSQNRDIVKTKEECLASPTIYDTSFEGVYIKYMPSNGGNKRVINFEGCQYEATGVIVCFDNDFRCAADWVPIDTFDPNHSEAIIGDKPVDPNEDGGNEGGGNGNGEGGSNGDGFDYERMAQANKDAFFEEFDKDALINEIDLADDSTELEIDNVLDMIFQGIRNLILDEGVTPELFIPIKEQMNLIGNFGDSPIVNDYFKEPFYNLFPKPRKCSPLIFGSGEVYEFSISCDVIELIKTLLSFVFYFFVFYEYFTVGTNLIRGGKE
ncbi:hypothetical protein ACT7LO_004427, partial [Providencia rettgeri]